MKTGLGFIPNGGQWDVQSKFLLRRDGLNMWVTNEGPVLDFYHQDKATYENTGAFTSAGQDFQQLAKVAPPTRNGHVVRVRFDGASGMAQTQGEDEQPGLVNYMVGDRSKWATHLANYREVTTKNITNGVNVRYYLDGASARYDVIVNQGTDPAAVSMRYEGAENLRVLKDGSISYSTSMGQVTDTGVFAYQKINGQVTQVNARFRLTGGNHVGFEVGKYDKSQPLVIDPLILIKSTYFGGSSTEGVNDLTKTPGGDLLVNGNTSSADFPVKVGAYKGVYGGNSDWYFALVRPELSTGMVKACTFFGSAGTEFASSVRISTGGNIYFAGGTSGTNIPTTAGTIKATGNANDIYVGALSQDLSKLIAGTYYGGSGNEQWGAMELQNNSIVLTGNTVSNNLPTSVSAVGSQKTLSGAGDAFVARISQDLKINVMCVYLGGAGGSAQSGEWGRAITISADNDAIFVAGQTDRFNFPVSGDAYDQTYNGGRDVFLARIRFDGVRTASTFYGTPGDDNVVRMNVTPSGVVTLVGNVNAPGLPVSSGVVDSTYSGSGNEGFLARFDASCTTLIRATMLGGSGSDSINTVAVMPSGNILLAGSTNSTDFPVTADATSAPAVDSSSSNAFLAEINNNLTSKIAITTFGGSGNDSATSLLLMGELNNIYVGGSTISGPGGSDFPIPTFHTPYDNVNAENEQSAFLCTWAVTRDPVVLELSGSSVIGGKQMFAAVKLNAPAGPSGMNITITTTNLGVCAPITTTFFIAPGEIKKSIKLLTSTVETSTPVTVSIVGSGTTRTASVTITP